MWKRALLGIALLLLLVVAGLALHAATARETLNKSLDALSKYETQTGGIDCEANDIGCGEGIRGARQSDA